MKKIIIILLAVLCSLSLFAACTKEPTMFTVSYVTGIDETIAPVQVEEGNTINEPKSLSADGKEFLGWFTDEGCTVKATFPMTITKNTTLYAGWKAITKKYTVSYVTGTNETIAPVQVEEGKTINEPKTLSADGKEFLGWFTDEGCTVKATFPMTITKNTTLYAGWKAITKKYTVSYVTGTNETIAPVQVEEGKTINEPKTLSTSGKKFMGWYLDEKYTQKATFPMKITKNTTLYASWNVTVDISAYLKRLLNNATADPYSYIPTTMRPGYVENLKTESNLNKDYSDFVSKKDIPDGGFGEQWHMITDNLNQSQRFFNLLTGLENITSTSIATFNNYIDKNPSDTANYNFMQGTYSVTINFDGTVIYYVLDYTANVFGSEQSIQIALSMNVNSGDRNVRIQIGDANALYYEAKENSYKFAIKYLGVRRAMFTVEKDTDGNVNGHIYEYLTVDGVGVNSSADFYITDKYVSAVGNKASGIVGFTGYITELYNVKNGKMLGYEVREVLKGITYNTYWFKLSDVNGIESIKYRQATDDETAAFFVNGRTQEWKYKTVGGFSVKMLSRRFDIEFRTQYFYSYNAQENVYTEYAVSIPMLFVQAENFEDLTKDVSSANSGVNVTVTMNGTDFDKLKSDYDKLIDIFIKNKDSITETAIIDFIGNKIVFSKT